MTQRTIYIFALTFGSFILTLPLFGTAITPIKILPTVVEAPTDTLPDCFGFPIFPFDGERVPQGILVKWWDLIELNGSDCHGDVASYELQHSVNAINFSTIIMSDDLQIGSYLHQSPVNGGNYYRLRMTNPSGDIWFTDIILIVLNLTPGSISPSIVDTEASLLIESPAEEPGELNIYDMSGRLIYSESINLQENSTLLGLDFTGWHTGHYVVTVSGEQLGNEVIRFVKR